MIVENVARYVHARWGNWIDHVFSHGHFNIDGSFEIDAEFVKTLQEKAEGDFMDLSDKDRDKAMVEAKQELQVIIDFYRKRDEDKG